MVSGRAVPLASRRPGTTGSGAPCVAHRWPDSSRTDVPLVGCAEWAVRHSCGSPRPPGANGGPGGQGRRTQRGEAGGPHREARSLPVRLDGGRPAASGDRLALFGGQFATSNHAITWPEVPCRTADPGRAGDLSLQAAHRNEQHDQATRDEKQPDHRCKGCQRLAVHRPKSSPGSAVRGR